ncbi:MAG: peptidylprolyl isomerase [Candidatus Krumholzibacteriota bacterium]|nr:peptidylprolyl isomerase [Candidatus Krumholzibacteriota bacterium]
MKGAIKTVFLVLLVLMALQNFPHAEGSGGEKEIIDRVVAIVQDKALLQSDIDMEYRQLLMQMQKTSLPPDEEKAKRREILDGLVAHLLMTVQAEKLGIEITEDKLDSEVERILEDNMRAIGGSDAFNLELQKAGMTLDQLKAQWREKIKANRLIERLKYQEGLMDVSVSEDAIKEYYRKHYNEFEKRPRTVFLAQILIFNKAEKSAEEISMAKINRISEILAKGGDFEETAKAFSEGPSAKYGGSLGFMKLDDLDNPRFVDAVRKLTVGEISGPVVTEHGVHIIKLEEISGDEVRLRHILVKMETDKEATREMAEGLRQDILNGADFGEMAKAYSEDWSTRDAGGDIGEIPVSQLPGFFMDSIKDLKAGDIAELIEEEKGFRIIRVTGWTEERPFNLDEARDRIRDIMQQESFMKKFDEYVESLKDLYYVDIKSESGL